MFYEVHIPTNDPNAQRTLHVEARSWRSALLAGMTQLNGKAPASLENFFVQLGPDAIVVTDPVARQTIRLSELDEKQIRASQVLRAVTGQHAPIGSPPPVAAATTARPTPGVSASRKALGFTDRSNETSRAMVSTEIRNPAGDADDARVLQDTIMPAPVSDAVVPEFPAARGNKKRGPVSEPVRKKAPVAASTSQPGEVVTETALEDVFLEIMTIFEPGFSMEQAIDFCLDLATKYIPCGSSGLLFASDAADHMYFAASRGDGRKKYAKAQLDIQRGIPASSLRDGVAIASSSALNPDPRHTDELAQVGGIDVHSVCCAPIQSGDRAFGVILLLNRQQRDYFSQYDSNIIAYIGTQLGRYIQDQLDSTPLE